ncbi:MAG: MATE family efflux transporter, partial [Frankiales bacterium]|nr:MATE family efflux transporter [Frankiales bacterium]
VLTELDRRIIGLAVPALGARIVEPAYTITDTAIVGHLGRAPQAGLALATTVLNLIGWTSAFLEMATTSEVAFRRGRADADGAARAATTAYAVALALGVVIGLVVAVAGPPLTAALGGHGATQHNATTYLRISAIGMPFLLLTLAGTGHLQGHEDTKTPLRIVLAANVVNVVLEVVLVYGAHTGVAGSAWGTVAAQIAAAAMFVVASRRRLPAITAPTRAELVILLRSGWALVVRTVALGAALVAATATAAQVGSATLAAHQVVLQIWLLLALTLDALAVPAQVYVGAALGAGDTAQAMAIGRRCLRLGLVAGGAVAVLTMALSPVLPLIFTGDHGVIGVAIIGLVVCGAMQPLASLAFVYDGLLLGAADYATLRRTMLVALLAFAPLAAATLAWHRLGITGIWLALACWLAARSALLARAWARRFTPA